MASSRRLPARPTCSVNVMSELRKTRMSFVRVRTGTAGAVPVRNAQGALTMLKVKVQRHIAGQKPAAAREASSSESDEEVVR